MFFSVCLFVCDKGSCSSRNVVVDASTCDTIIPPPAVVQDWETGHFVAVQWRTELSNGNLTECYHEVTGRQTLKFALVCIRFSWLFLQVLFGTDFDTQCLKASASWWNRLHVLAPPFYFVQEEVTLQPRGARRVTTRKQPSLAESRHEQRTPCVCKKNSRRVDLQNAKENEGQRGKKKIQESRPKMYRTSKTPQHEIAIATLYFIRIFVFRPSPLLSLSVSPTHS